MRRKPIFGYRAMIGSILAIGFLSFIVWGHHMFITGMNPFLGSVFVFTTLLIAIPSAVKVFNYLTTLWRGNIVFSPAMLFSIGWWPPSSPAVSRASSWPTARWTSPVHDTYFVVAHFHIVMGMSAIFGMFAGVYHWFPRMYGRMMNTKLGYPTSGSPSCAPSGCSSPCTTSAWPVRRVATTATRSSPCSTGVMDLNVLVTVFAIIGAWRRCSSPTTSSTASGAGKGRAEPVAQQHPGMDHARGAHPRQLAGSAAHGAPLALRLQQAGQARGLRAPDGALEPGEEED
jgi:cytochrome c oxidase subunit 1